MVIQGSILGPLFFVLFMNDLPDEVCSVSTIALYADDSKMFRVMNDYIWIDFTIGANAA